MLNKKPDLLLEYFKLKKLGPFRIQADYKPKRKVGHFDFAVYLKNLNNQRSQLPIVTGIYSKGNKTQHIQPWLDIHFIDWVNFNQEKPLLLSQVGSLVENLFQMIGSVISPGGMIFLSYITDLVWGQKSELCEVTRHSLSLSTTGIPPAVTPLGRLLFISGCRNIKSDAYDVQGSSRLAGEKAPTFEFEKQFTLKLIEQLKQYLAKKPKPEYEKLEKICRTNAANILNQITNSL